MNRSGSDSQISGSSVGSVAESSRSTPGQISFGGSCLNRPDPEGAPISLHLVFESSSLSHSEGSAESTRSQTTTRPQRKVATLERCKCGAVLEADSNFCRLCGSQRSQPERCRCGAVFEADSIFCRMCGFQRSQPARRIVSLDSESERSNGGDSIRKAKQSTTRGGGHTPTPKIQKSSASRAAGGLPSEAPHAAAGPSDSSEKSRRLTKRQRQQMTKLYSDCEDMIAANPHSFDAATFHWPAFAAEPSFRHNFIVQMNDLKAKVLRGEAHDRCARTVGQRAGGDLQPPWSSPVAESPQVRIKMSF